MTVNATDRRAGPYLGNGVATSFDFAFKVFAKADLRVVITTDEGIESDGVLDSDYRVTLNVDQDNDPGGTVTYQVSAVDTALPDDYTLTIVGNLEFEQTTDLANGGAFNAQVIENALDRNVMLIQQVSERTERTLQLPVSTDLDDVSTELPAPSANKVIGWNEDGTALQNVDAADLATAIAYGESEVDVFTGDGITTQFGLSENPGALNNLLVILDGVAQRAPADYTWVSGTTLTMTSAPADGAVLVVRYQRALDIGVPAEGSVGFDSLTETLRGSLLPTPIEHGADSTGVAACDTAFGDWIDAIAGKSGLVPPGTYRLTTGDLAIAANTTIVFANATIDISDCPVGASFLKAVGTEGTRYALTADATAGGTTATVSAANLIASGIAGGDWVRICSDEQFDPGRTASKIGEQIKVKSVNTGTGVVTFETPLVDSYATADSATMSKMSHVANVELRGNWKVIGGNNNSDHRGVWFEICERPYVEGMRAEGVDDRALYFFDCIAPRGHNLDFQDFQNDGTAYGISCTAATQDALFTQITGRDVRHLFTTNNTNTRPGIPRRIVVDGFNAAQSAPTTGGTGGDAMDTHAACEDVHFLNGVVQGSSGQGVNFEGRSGSIVNVAVYDSASNGVVVTNFSNRPGDYTLQNVHVYRAAGTYGIRVQTSSTAQGVIERLCIDNISGTDCAVPVNINGTSTYPIQRAQINGVTVLRGTNGTACMTVEQVQSGSVSNVNVSGGTQVAATALRIRDCKNLSVSGITGSMPSSATGVFLYLNATSAGATDAIVVDNIAATSPSAVSSRGILVDNNATNIGIGRNWRLSDFSTRINWGTGTGHVGGFLAGTATYDPPSLAAGAKQQVSMTVTGAQVGDKADVTFSNVDNGIRWSGEVTASNAVRVTMENVSGGAIDLASGTLKAVVTRMG